MGTRRIRTAPLDSNQARIDELEYFIEGIGRFLFGEEGEDFRRLGEYTPRTRNLSALLDLCREGGGRRDIAEDLRFLHAELEVRGVRRASSRPATASRTVFRYVRYNDLLLHPEKLLGPVPPSSRLEVVSLIARGLESLAPVLVKLNAYAWLGVVGVPNLEAELGTTGRATIVLPETAAEVEAGLEPIIATIRGRVGRGLRAFCLVAHRELTEEYRAQLARLAAKTQPL